MNFSSQACRATAYGLLAFLIYSAPAQAQMIDYASLEALFEEPVTTSATGQPQRASDVPVAMDIITAEEIRRSGAVDIPGVLRNSSGLSVWQWSRKAKDVSVRGYNQSFSPRLLVLVNGRQVYSDMYGNTLWENIPIQLEEIRQIEIVKGPNSALFGFNAVGGVVNIITYNPIYDDISSVGVTVGSGKYRDGHLVHTEKIGEKAGLRISAGSSASDEFTAPAGVGPFDDARGRALSIDSVIQFTPDSQLRIEVSETKAEAIEYSPVYTPFDTLYDTYSARALYTMNTSLGMIQANVYRNWQKLFAAGLFNVVAKNEVTVAQIEDLFQIGTDHNFRLQAEYRHNALWGTLQSPGSEIAYDVYAASGMWHWKMRDNLAWSNALRLDHLRLGRTGALIVNPVITSNAAFDQNLTEFSYNSGLVWNVSDADTLRLTASRGIQAPSLLNFGIDLALGPDISLGNPELEASIVNNYEVMYDRKIAPLNGLFRSSLFYQETKDIQGLGALVTGVVAQADNIGTTRTVGLEAGLEGRVGSNWNWDTSYTLQSARDDLTVNGGVITVPYNGADATPTHMIKAHVGYTKDRWETDLFAQYVSHYKVLIDNGAGSYNEVKAGGHVSMSGRVGYRVTDNITVALSGQELNHSEATETSGPKRERQVFLSLKAKF